MAKTLDLGRRIELCSMDPQCANISLGLYVREQDGTTCFKVHSYSFAPGAGERVAFVSRALSVLVGLDVRQEGDGWLQFPCGAAHARAIKRAFLDVCKLASDAELPSKPLRNFDKKADCDLEVVPRGPGSYEVVAAGEHGKAARRAEALAGGFVKLCEMSLGQTSAHISFPCGVSHDALLGLLMSRAQNVRAALREDQLASGRGVLAAPSQQK